ncbi:ADP-heptose:LPS heptosyltransferase [Desulfobaculum xiamenense]|uniref:ADP-heptose:LPS heptosyltransferase n=1 Tax=Desulfobaculum xiamenense TaxID=995050 RepID=A0A846QTE9_9BACT|nr:glycosyltransferase family 9 protein [Desulfobaculum xiamenense]NJB68454.1 ADP-heptose:LPS heptosyltransferase [Desulfobaculum xiamenense]
MTDARPILVLQTLRMGDLILSFPLCLWLMRAYPGHPVWVAAEEMFFRDLMPIGPQVVYFSWNEASFARLRQERFHLVVNLSHDDRAAKLAGELRSDETIGPVRMPDGTRYIRGAWQLYRASLVGGNRHNLFHWADLNALDVVPPSLMAATGWPQPRILSGAARRNVGLFLGASDEAKRPDATFWAELGRQLLRRGLRPMLFGGPKEVELAREVAAGLPGDILNLAGRLNLAEFAATGQAVELLVTPDTGPMHLAAWTGLHTLNLSMGNVNCRETGPYQPGHHVLRARLSCSGCWSCSRGGAQCRANVRPAAVSYVVSRLVSEGAGRLARAGVPGLALEETGRDAHGLYDSTPLEPPREATARELLDRFWQAFWAARFGLWDRRPAESAYAALAESHPRLRERMAAAVAEFGRDLKPALRKGAQAFDPGFWKSSVPAIQPLRSWCQMHLSNSDWSAPALRDCLAAAEELVALDEALR